MANTPHLGITLLEQSQAQKEVTVNEAFYRIDVLLNSGVIDKDLATPPGSPAQGAVYIVAASPTGAWSGKAGQVAYFDQIWRFIVPNEGLALWVMDENKRYLHNGTAWEILEAGGGGGTGDMLAATYDAANIAQQVVGTTATQTLTNKILTAPTINGTVAGDAVLKLCQARLTLTSATPVTTSNVSGASTLYLTPYKGNHIALYDGSAWKALSFTEITHTLSGMTSGRPYDVFAYISSGAVAVEKLVWTNDTTRATALTTQNGVLVKSGDATRRYIGTFYTTGTTTTEDSAAKRFVWNYYNRTARLMEVKEGTDSWTYSTSSYRQANGSTANQLDYVQGVAEDMVECNVLGIVFNSTSNLRSANVAVGVDSTSVISGVTAQSVFSSAVNAACTASYKGYPGVGRHYLAWLERAAGADTQTWYGDNGGAVLQAGIHGIVWG